LKLIENPDVLKTIAGHPERPGIVVGFAAETENVIDNAKAKLVPRSLRSHRRQRREPGDQDHGGDAQHRPSGHP
jgi:phosphopantothenoylcysteine synthetase/decarboxylase